MQAPQFVHWGSVEAEAALALGEEDEGALVVPAAAAAAAPQLLAVQAPPVLPPQEEEDEEAARASVLPQVDAAPRGDSRVSSRCMRVCVWRARGGRVRGARQCQGG